MGLTRLERLEDIANFQNIEIRKYKLPKSVRGLYYEEGDYRVITINKDVKTQAEEACIMAEEIGHSVVGGGDLFFPEGVDPVLRRKAELRAKAWGYNELVPAKKLIQKLKQQMEIWDIADFFSVTEDFVREAIEHYMRKGLIL